MQSSRRGSTGKIPALPLTMQLSCLEGETAANCERNRNSILGRRRRIHVVAPAHTPLGSDRRSGSNRQFSADHGGRGWVPTGVNEGALAIVSARVGIGLGKGHVIIVIESAAHADIAAQPVRVA